MDNVLRLQILHSRRNLGRHKDEAADAENKLFTVDFLLLPFS